MIGLNWIKNQKPKHNLETINKAFRRTHHKDSQKYPDFFPKYTRHISKFLSTKQFFFIVSINNNFFKCNIFVI